MNPRPTSPIAFALYEQACIGLSYGSTSQWRHPEDDRLNSLEFDFWIHLAKIAEDVNLDALFFGDVLGMSDGFNDSAHAAITHGKELPAHDPFSIAPAILAATQRLGVVVTASTTYEHPFSLARRFSTLDHLSAGRIGWNVVTSYLPNAAANYGLDAMIDHDLRYDYADEFLEVGYKLWEGSWADDAYVADRESGVFALSDRVRTIDHEGSRYRVKGPHLSNPSPQRTPLLFQAGWSPRGRRFAAKHAEVVFAGSQTAQAMSEGIADVKERARVEGRGADDIRFFGAFSLVSGATDSEVQRNYDRLQEIHATAVDARQAAFAGWAGIDLGKLADDDIVKPQRTGHTESALTDKVGRARKPITAGEIRQKMTRLEGDNPTVYIGTYDEVAQSIEDYVGESGVDGLVLRSFLSPGSLEQFGEHIVPRLIERGVYRESAPEGTFRSRFSAGADDRLPRTHSGAQYRW